jgi:hypothetical protein
MNYRSISWLSMITAGLAGAMLASSVVAATPDLTGRFDGTYTYAGAPSSQTVQLEVERQHGRRLRVSVFAMNAPEYMGHGRVSRDGTTVKVVTHATGHRHLLMMGDVLNAGASLAGTFTSKRSGQPTVTGTFAVAR